jgi:hypothetical protein
MRKYKLYFYVVVQGYDQPVPCAIDFESECDPEDAYVVGEAIAKGMGHGKQYGYAEEIK